ncbi:MaoC/PaaZ C-terminal domain-containing protein [Sabulicella glaciei]|uniref:MaoC/PaaZ C-terminal domain-containing protein n=1 Tax=Sabulicella glaciei TaxID=2984948 RepID=A0ABT3NW01_9PROT|nr:MaoC/PaaZ C-terminal domain-containing protein [Roseococcus sp. MDT2-1-1]MCW8086320.1 MaoC/PaaZ C-terminal domain-containing protein [Roseococcus sp. MDT2-1-1]
MKPLSSWREMSPGQRFDFGTLALGEAEIIEYARKFDPQPFHTDPEAARQAPLFNGLVASGLHTMGACFGRIMGSGLFVEVSLGGSRIDTRWPAALRPDEEIRVEGEVLAAEAHRKRPGMGVVTMRYTGTRIADGMVVITMEGTHFLKE